jgi:hypothetical protein
MNDNLPIQHIKHVEGFESGAEECLPVAVLVAADDEWSAQKAIELIKAAPEMYKALDELVAEIYRNDLTGTAGDLSIVQDAERAIAHAKGGVLQRDTALAKAKRK